jgi:hypothetical protein
MKNCGYKRGGASRYISSLQSAEKKEHKAINALARIASRKSGGRVVRRAIKNKKGTHMSGMIGSACDELFERWADEAGLADVAQMSNGVSVKYSKVGGYLGARYHGPLFDKQLTVKQRKARTKKILQEARKVPASRGSSGSGAVKHSRVPDSVYLPSEVRYRKAQRALAKKHGQDFVTHAGTTVRHIVKRPRSDVEFLWKMADRAATKRDKKRAKRRRSQMSRDQGYTAKRYGMVYGPAETVRPTRKELLSIGEFMAKGHSRPRLAAKKRAIAKRGRYTNSSGRTYEYNKEGRHGILLGKSGSFVREASKGGAPAGPWRQTRKGQERYYKHHPSEQGDSFRRIAASERAAAKRRGRRRKK